ncbi:MAG TPA: hypothetical protein VLS49_13380 [Usitatibacter sp.]|nr:hypothetical protein [Usitatibacter sp.]
MAWRGALARCFAILLLGLSGAVGAQTSGGALVGVAGTDLATGELFFECSGSPTCTGEFVVVSQDSGCSNPVSVAGTIQLTAPDLSVAGPVSGSGTLTADWSSQHNADGTCTPVAGSTRSQPLTFSGTSDGVMASVTYTVTDTDGSVHTAAGTLFNASVAYGNAQVSGSVSAGTPGGGHVAITFTCVGSPFCTGSYSGSIQDSGCSNAFPLSGTITLTGFDLSGGSLGGSVVLQNADTHDQQNADGTCTLSSLTDVSASYAGTFNGSSGTLTVTGTDDHGNPFQIPGTFSASGIGNTPPPSSPPPFQITVNPNITPTTASATAQIQPPAADVGKTVSIYVFAFAPRSIVKSALLAKDDTSGCALAQYDPSTGQLRAASASSLVPALTGTLSAQGQSVTILNNASTPAVAGATFFVGYGADAATMISNGINASAVQIPGSQQCPSIFPKTPGALSGLWWAGDLESGWGIDFTQREDHVFAAFYTYDDAGQPKWYFASDCRMPASGLESGRCAGDLYEVTASPLFGIAPSGSHNPLSQAGTLQVDFADPSRATMSYTVGGVSRAMPIQRQVFASGSTPPTVDYTDLWWNAAQSGWGIAISHQYNIMFLAWFAYDASGKPVWYVASKCDVVASGNGCSGPLYRVTGPPFAPTFDAAQVHPTPVGSVGVTFTDPNNGTINYTVNGATASKAITRQVF